MDWISPIPPERLQEARNTWIALSVLVCLAVAGVVAYLTRSED